MHARGQMLRVQEGSELNAMAQTESEFLEHYANIVAKAKECLAKANLERDPGCWPAGQTWEQLSGSSKSVFMRRACKALGVSRDEYLSVVRNWPYSEEAWGSLDGIFGK